MEPISSQLIQVMSGRAEKRCDSSSKHRGEEQQINGLALPRETSAQILKNRYMETENLPRL
jgi:hypothetical protein